MIRPLLSNNLWYYLALSLLAGLCLILPLLVDAEWFNCEGGEGPDRQCAANYTPMIEFPGITGKTTFIGVINNLYILCIIIGGIVAVLRLVLAGASYMMSDVITTKAQARGDILGSLVGLGIILSAVLILNTINPNLTNINVEPTSQMFAGIDSRINNAIDRYYYDRSPEEILASACSDPDSGITVCRSDAAGQYVNKTDVLIVAQHDCAVKEGRFSIQDIGEGEQQYTCITADPGDITLVDDEGVARLDYSAFRKFDEDGYVDYTIPPSIIADSDSDAPGTQFSEQALVAILADCRSFLQNLDPNISSDDLAALNATPVDNFSRIVRCQL